MSLQAIDDRSAQPQELCKICYGPVEIQIRKGTGICCLQCEREWLE